ncbi:MAG TPA: CPBP family glutamic-type intramembrane protease [Kofleriaceae bacterium]|nr:CPBP family glutamic-type intramembrane protease [Kofleriaceae bacterium]
MAQSRELRGLVIVEILAIVGLAFVPLPAIVPVAVPLLVLASLSRWTRGRDWGELFHGGLRATIVGATAGIVGLALALAIGTPLVEHVTDRAVEWSMYTLVRGNASQLFAVAIYVAVTSLAAELALRGWIVERVLELASGRPGVTVLAILIGSAAEMIVTPGNFAMRAGAGLFGAGLGMMYVAGNRSIVAPICARMAFALGALMLESMKLVG